jgi:hypothetical protein
MASRFIAVVVRFPIGTLIAIIGPDGLYVGLEMVDCPLNSSSYGQRVSQTPAGDRVDASTGNNHRACSAIVIAAFFEHGCCSVRGDDPYRVTTVRAHDAGAT